MDESDRFFPLKWRELGSDRVFKVSQAADGMPRVIALVALLLQPGVNWPMVLILDEPELGLHPFAMNVLSGLIRTVALKTQVLIATQSMTLIDYFEPQDLIVAERENRKSCFKHLDPRAL